MAKKTSRQNILSRISNGETPLLIEALPVKYYAEGHLPGAKHLPHTEVKSRAGEVAPDKNAAIIVYCASSTCNNSHEAAAVFEMLGYTDVSVYSGGKQDWKEAGLDLETA